jgi:hypothetical protein
VEAADAIAARPAVHWAVDSVLSVGTGAVTAVDHALILDSTGHADAGRTDVAHRAEITIVAKSPVVARRMSTL